MYENTVLTLFSIVVIASDIINVTLVIAGDDCADGEYNQLWEKLRKMVTKLFYATHLYNQPLLFSYPWGIDKFDNYNGKVDCKTGWAVDGQAE